MRRRVAVVVCLAATACGGGGGYDAYVDLYESSPAFADEFGTMYDVEQFDDLVNKVCPMDAEVLASEIDRTHERYPLTGWYFVYRVACGEGAANAALDASSLPETEQRRLINAYAKATV